MVRISYTILMAVALTTGFGFAPFPTIAQEAATLEPQTKPIQSPDSLKLAGIFGNHMVIQRESDVAFWGTAKPGSTVTVTPSWSQKAVQTTADDEGEWRTTLKTPSAGGPHTIDVKSGSQSKRLKDILSGEVWICWGQSNMQWKLRGFGPDHWKEEVEKAEYPGIRFCAVPQVLGLKEQNDILAKWTTCNPQTAMSFSAVGYFFGSKLHTELDVPIGLISSNWGGSSAEAWVSPEVINRDFPEFGDSVGRYDGWIEQAGETYKGKEKPKGLNHRCPSVLYNSMLRPLMPFSFRGVVWYQGESNVKQPEQYQKLFPALIRDWRDRWDIGEFPFYFVQIAPFAYKREPVSAAFLREAQMMTLSEPNTGMAVTMDIGDPTNIHPKKKKPVGERLARLALNRTYGRSDIVDSGPLYSGYEVDGNKIRLRFTSVGGGLASRDSEPLTHFTIAGADKAFVEAQAVIDGDSIVVSSVAVKEPVAVRFAWGSGDMPNLANKDGLPASSFRTDSWLIQ